MKLTQEQQEILNGSRGETMAKVMETLVRYGELYDSDTMIPVTGKNNHLVTSFGLKALTPVYERRGPFPAPNSPPTPGLWTRTYPAAFCRTSFSTTSCTASRTFMRISYKSWA